MHLSFSTLLAVLLLPVAIASPVADVAGSHIQPREGVATIPIRKRDRAVSNGVVNIDILRGQLDRATA
jgi:hypothetical protein